MNIKKLKQNILRFLGKIFLSFFINLLCKTVKISEKKNDEFKKILLENKNFVLAFWHGKMIIPWYLYRNKNFVAIVSQSKDGTLLANLLKSWNYQTVRGSSNKGGKEALGILTDMAKEGNSIAITPDGPKGPNKKMKAGAFVIAQRAEIPLIIMNVKYQKKYKLNSWDKLEIPKPFTKADITYLMPIYINKEKGKEYIEKVMQKCETELNKMID